jgi:CubicO group peptidase (beta-lactamase class C family)
MPLVPTKPLSQAISSIDWFNWDTMAAAGGVISCSDDMAKWLQLQLRRGQLPGGERLFSEASSHRMWTPHTVIPVSQAAAHECPPPTSAHAASAGCWPITADALTAGHGGGYDGMYSQVLLVPEEDLGIVVLTNSMTGIGNALTMTIADLHLSGQTGQPGQWLQQGLEQDRSGREAFYDRIKKAGAARRPRNSAVTRSDRIRRTI